MKRKWLLLAALFWCAGGAILCAQDGPPDDSGDDTQERGGSGGGRNGPGSGPMAMLSVDKLKTSLELTDEQCQKLKPLLEKAKAVFESMHKDMASRRSGGGKSSGGMDAMQKKMEQVKKKLLEAVAPAQKFLSAEQYKALVKKLTERPQPPGGGRGGPGDSSDGDRQNSDSDRSGDNSGGNSSARSGDRKGGPGNGPGGGPGGHQVAAKLAGAVVVDAKALTAADKKYTSEKDDTSAIYVKNGGKLTLTNPEVTTSGNTSSQDGSSFYGLNAGIVVAKGSKAVITGGSVSTTGSGANAVFAVGKGAEIALSDMKLTAVGSGGHGVMATQGGVLTLNRVDVTTSDERAGAIATDRGGGTITVNGGTIKTSGKGSPGIYSTGDITCNDAVFISDGAEAVVIEGANSTTLNDCALTSGKLCGAMLYQSFSGDAEGANGTFTMNRGSLTVPVGPAFLITNTTGNISLTGVKLSVESGVLVKASAGRWGHKGSNGGRAVITAVGQKLNGNLVCDKISSIRLSLAGSSVLTGAVNTAAVKMDASSKWVVTADSTVTALAVAGNLAGLSNISGNGHTVKYDASLDENLWLEGKSYDLSGGGKLIPGK